MQQNERLNGLNGLNGQQPRSKPAVIRVEQLTKNYYLGRNVVKALRGVNLEVQQGEFVALMGPSGSGKSTFMNLLGCLDRPTSGSYLLDGVDVSKMNANSLADIRNQKIGFVFQSFNLLSWMTALDNVELPLVYAGVPRSERLRRARLALGLVGLKARASHRPAELSGGQQQRVAIARALVTSPALFLADEPTGNLDSATSLQIIAILQELNARGLTVVLVTHEPDIATCAKRQVKFRDGRVVDDTGIVTPVIVREDPPLGTRFIASASTPASASVSASAPMSAPASTTTAEPDYSSIPSPFQNEDEDEDAHKGPHPTSTPPASLHIGGQEVNS